MLRTRLQSRLLLYAVLGAGLAQAASIRYHVTPLDGPSGAGRSPTGVNSAFRLDYEVTDLQLLAFQELDIRFTAASFVTLFNPIAGPGVDVLVLQPNNPPGAAGDLSILALIGNPNLGNLSIDVVTAGRIPGFLHFSVNEYDPQTLEFVRTVTEDRAVLDGVPEPATWSLLATGLLCLGALKASKRI